MGDQILYLRHRGPTLPANGNRKTASSASCFLRAVATVFVCLAVLLAIGAPVNAQTSRHALLIGINDYLHSYAIPDLRFAQDDAEALQRILTESDFNVHVLKSNLATRNSIVAELNRYARELGPDDDFILFFAGHGARRENNGQTYWLAYDADVQELDVNGIRLDHLLDYVNDIRARNKLVLLDHCYAGDVNVPPPGSSSGRGTGSRGPGDGARNLDRGVFRIDDVRAELKKPRNLTVIAGARDEAYEDSTLGHGVFTKALIEALGDGKADGAQGGQLDDRVDVSELIEYTRSRVFTIADTTELHAQGFVQEVISYSVFENSADFEVITLSSENISQDDIDRFTLVLGKWGGEGVLGAAVMEACLNALTRKAAGSPLDELDEKILQNVQRYVEFAGDEARNTAGNALNVVINGLLENQ